MTTKLLSASLALWLAAGGFASAGDYGQLAASAGLSPAEAGELGLAEIVIAKINADNPEGDAQIRVSSRALVAVPDQLAANAGLAADVARGFGLPGVAAAKFGRDADRDGAVGAGASFGAEAAVDPDRDAQLIAAAGLTPAEARGLTLGELFAAKIDRESGDENR